MTQAKQPDDHPDVEEMPQHEPKRDPTGVAPNGVPPEVTQGEATGLPTSERNETESTAHPGKHAG